MEDARGFGSDEVNGRLVVLELYVLPADLLLAVLLLLQPEDVLVEEKLQRLVGVVDAQLLEAVEVKILGEIEGERDR